MEKHVYDIRYQTPSGGDCWRTVMAVSGEDAVKAVETGGRTALEVRRDGGEWRPAHDFRQRRRSLGLRA